MANEHQQVAADPVLRAGKFLGYALLALALAVMLLRRFADLAMIGALPSAAVALLCAAVGLMLLFTHAMVVGLYRQIAANPGENEG